MDGWLVSLECLGASRGSTASDRCEVRGLRARYTVRELMAEDRKSSRIPLPLAILLGFLVVVCVTFIAYRPDRPVATIVPGSSSGPAFVVQIIRPRLGLPLAGVLPPQLFGIDAHLGFDSNSPGASVDNVGPRRIELSADGWELVLVLGAQGRATSETQVVFELMFEDQLRKVRCRLGDPNIGTVSTTVLAEGELSGSFDVELGPCEDAGTGESLGWPRQLLLHGSFDRLPVDG